MADNKNNIILIVTHGGRNVKSDVCSVCNRAFVYKERVVSKESNHHRKYYCLKCAEDLNLIYLKNKAYTDLHKERILASSKKYRDSHKEKIRKYQDNYKKKHPERIKAYQKAYRDKNKKPTNKWTKVNGGWVKMIEKEDSGQI